MRAAIRGAAPPDLPEIERLLTEAGLPLDGVADMVNATPSHVFVAETDTSPGTLIAVAGLELRGDNALLRSVAVQPEWQGHGVGRDLVNRILRHAEERGIVALYLLTVTAEHYFPRFGFEFIDRAEVPGDIAETQEFRVACPASAVAMWRAVP